MSREEDAYVIERMGKLLAEIAIIVNGPEPHDTLWSYHDLPEKVRALKQAQQPAALAGPSIPDAIPPMSDVEERALNAAQRDRQWGYQKGWNDCRAAMLAQQPAAAEPAEADAEALDFARKAARLLHGFMLDTNAIGAKEAGVNLARSIKAMLAAAERKGVEP